MPKLTNYLLEDEILARGFSSIVYKGFDKISNQQVAIKCIDESVLDDQQKKMMLANELKIQWELKPYPNIVQIKAQFYQQDSIYIVTQFCQYGDLISKIKQKGKFIQAKAVSYILDIIQGFKAIFKHEIVHRDIKSSNIFISQKGIKIGDFGFSYKIEHNTKNQNDNAPSAGSPLYMAPEVLEDGNNSSQLSDVWSIGVVFFEMVTGKLPFPGKSKEGLMKLIQHIAIRSIIPENISLRSKEFILRTLKKDPSKRMTPEELIKFEFDDQILFKINLHRARKRQEEMKRQAQKTEEKNSTKNLDLKKVNPQNMNPNIPKNNSEINFTQFDNNAHHGKFYLDPKDIHAQKMKRKSNEKKTPKNETTKEEQIHGMKKQQIINLLLSQIDIIRFLSRILHKIQQIHHLHISVHQQDRKHSSEKHKGSQKHQVSIQKNIQHTKNEQYPQVYVQMKLFMYQVISEIEKLQFLSEEQALELFRCDEFQEIKLILDTYKSKLDLAGLKTIKWKGILSFEQGLEKQILIVYNKIKIYIAHYQVYSSLDSESRKMKKLTHKIQALHYMIVLRYDYLIIQRQQVLIYEKNHEKGSKHYEKCMEIQAIIEDKHSKNNQGKKSFEENKNDLKKIEVKMKQYKLI